MRGVRERPLFLLSLRTFSHAVSVGFSAQKKKVSLQNADFAAKPFYCLAFHSGYSLGKIKQFLLHPSVHFETEHESKIKMAQLFHDAIHGSKE